MDDYDIDLLYTMNMDHINLIYSKYSKMNKDTKYKGHNEEYICYLDCVQMLREDSLLKLSNRMIGEAFSMSKMTVINEPEREG